MDLDQIAELVEPNDSKIVLLVMDGVGGLPMEEGGKTELETADTPNLDRLAERGICGLQQPVAPGVTPGSGPAHLGLFGYDALQYQVGRGVLSGLGIGFDLKPDDVAARGNFCTLDEDGNVADRRAGRIPSEKGAELCRLLDEQIDLPDVEVFVRPVKEYRFLLVLRGEGLSGAINDTDPQELGAPPLEPQAQAEGAERTAELVRQFLDQTRDILSDRHPANMGLLRGFSQRPDWPDMEEAFGLDAAAIAVYPMYRGVARLVGMDVLETGAGPEEELQTLAEQWDEHDFFFVHIKPIDSAGEDGDFDRKVSLIEEVDQHLPKLLDLEPDVLIVTGDHSTPSYLKYHSWHPVPTILWSQQCRPDAVSEFGERACMTGGLGPRLPAPRLMPLALANALRLEKYGA
jgi:2,3-bisphosphoglycerate-independent phosphoglycerate mutase